MKAELRNEVLHIPGLTNHLQAYTHARARAGEYSRSSLPGVRLPADQETFNAASRSQRKREREELSNLYCGGLRATETRDAETT